MSQANALRVSVTDLRRPGATRDVEVDVTATVPGLQSDAVEIAPDVPIHVSVHLERVSDGIVVRGEIDAQWRGQCSRCLQPVSDEVRVHVDELYEADPVEGETYRLGAEYLDLEPLVRDALVLELPHTPLCQPDCRGLCPNCGTDRNTSSCDCEADEADPRWAALRSLDI
jgi:uncharacterized protein